MDLSINSVVLLTIIFFCIGYCVCAHLQLYRYMDYIWYNQHGTTEKILIPKNGYRGKNYDPNYKKRRMTSTA